ncbi:uncharacterized protein LOC141627897 [Silene latifolia]|uniref:uncharacterized protein LOC141627897 n=1 Tax=Silene latifolia TaxID=37657 RepID=UPI003D7716C2
MGVLKYTSVTLQMADRSIKCLLGVLEDVPVKVGAVIDVKDGKLTLEVGDDKVTYNLNSAMNSPMLEESCYPIEVLDIVDVVIENSIPRSLAKDPLETLLLLESFAVDDEIGCEEVDALEVDLDGEELSLEESSQFVGLVSTPQDLEVQKPEIKALPSNLKYAFLDKSEMCPVIISFHLSEIQLSSLFLVSRTHKKAIGYKLDDLKSISPDFFMHRIYLEEDHKPSVQGQRRLNPNMQEVVKKEVIKLLDAGIIYEIFDAKWRCEEVDLVLNWEKCHIMENEGMMLGHIISERGIEVDRTKVQVIEQLPPPRCVSQWDVKGVLEGCHSSPYGGHHRPSKTISKVLQSGFYWPTMFRDAKNYVMTYDACQRTDSISRRHKIPLNVILEVEVFYVWGIDYLGPFPTSKGNRYILVIVDYVSKWVEAIATPTNDARAVINLFKMIIFPRFGVPRAVISDYGTHFGEKQLGALLAKYGVSHRRGLAYHPQTCGQVEVSNHELKSILEKVVAKSRKDWRVKLYDTLWAYHIPHSRHLLVPHHIAYESSRLYKEKTKRWHDKKILKKEFKIGDKVLLFNSHFKLFLGKLRSRWPGPFSVTNVNKFGSVEVMTTNGETFKANDHHLKVYHDSVIVGIIEEVSVNPLHMEA